MSAGPASLCSTLLFVSVFVFVSADQEIITAESGQDVTLTCRAANNKIISVHWSRADLEDKYVLLYQDGHFDPDDQHPSFMNQVDLQDRQMKDGDVSVILKNVTTDDVGTYKCRVLMEGARTWDLISSISLHVDPPGQSGGHTEDGGKEEEGQKDEGKKHEVKKEEGQKDERRKDEGRKDESVALNVLPVLLVAAAVGVFFLI